MTFRIAYSVANAACIAELTGHVVTGNVENLIFAKILEKRPVPRQQLRERIARGAIREDTDEVPAHLAFLQLVVIKEREQRIVILRSINNLKEFEYLFLELESSMFARFIRSYAYCLEQRGECVSDATIF